jgi:hypothetical protein
MVIRSLDADHADLAIPAEIYFKNKLIIPLLLLLLQLHIMHDQA